MFNLAIAVVKVLAKLFINRSLKRICLNTCNSFFKVFDRFLFRLTILKVSSLGFCFFRIVAEVNDKAKPRILVSREATVKKMLLVEIRTVVLDLRRPPVQVSHSLAN